MCNCLEHILCHNQHALWLIPSANHVLMPNTEIRQNHFSIHRKQLSPLRHNFYNLVFLGYNISTSCVSKCHIADDSLAHVSSEILAFPLRYIPLFSPSHGSGRGIHAMTVQLPYQYPSWYRRLLTAPCLPVTK